MNLVKKKRSYPALVIHVSCNLWVSTIIITREFNTPEMSMSISK